MLIIHCHTISQAPLGKGAEVDCWAGEEKGTVGGGGAGRGGRQAEQLCLVRGSRCLHSQEDLEESGTLTGWWRQVEFLALPVTPPGLSVTAGTVLPHPPPSPRPLTLLCTPARLQSPVQQGLQKPAQRCTSQWVPTDRPVISPSLKGIRNHVLLKRIRATVYGPLSQEFETLPCCIVDVDAEGS